MSAILDIQSIILRKYVSTILGIQGTNSAFHFGRSVYLFAYPAVILDAMFIFSEIQSTVHVLFLVLLLSAVLGVLSFCRMSAICSFKVLSINFKWDSIHYIRGGRSANEFR